MRRPIATDSSGETHSWYGLDKLSENVVLVSIYKKFGNTMRGFPDSDRKCHSPDGRGFRDMQSWRGCGFPRTLVRTVGRDGWEEMRDLRNISLNII